MLIAPEDLSSPQYPRCCSWHRARPAAIRANHQQYILLPSPMPPTSFLRRPQVYHTADCVKGDVVDCSCTCTHSNGAAALSRVLGAVLPAGVLATRAAVPAAVAPAAAAAAAAAPARQLDVFCCRSATAAVQRASRRWRLPAGVPRTYWSSSRCCGLSSAGGRGSGDEMTCCSMHHAFHMCPCIF